MERFTLKVHSCGTIAKGVTCTISVPEGKREAEKISEEKELKLPLNWQTNINFHNQAAQ